MQFSLEQLEAFVTAAETGSFSAAAKKLGKAQSRISTAIANLEIDLDVMLFDRSAKLPVLTQQGEQLLLNAYEILEKSHRMLDRAMHLSQGIQPILRIAIDELLPVSLTADALEGFAGKFPETEVEVLWAALGDVAEIVASGKADVGIDLPVGLTPSIKCSWKIIANTDFCYTVAPHHPLAKKKKLSHDELIDYRQLMPTDSERSDSLTEFRFSHQAWKCEDSKLILELTRRGLGWTVAPRYQATADLKKGRLVEITPYPQRSGMVQSFYYIWDHSHTLTEPEEWLFEEFSKKLSAICSAE